MKARSVLFLGAGLVAFLFGCGGSHADLRVGYAPNITHAQALVGFSNGTFEAALAPATVESRIFHAGPSAIEALFAEAIDVAYVGPVPAINAYVRSGGRFVVIGGAAFGGAAVVVRGGSGINSIADLQGKRIATPQLGNTQDVTARAWFSERGIEAKSGRGEVPLFPVPNPEHIALFFSGSVDASWTVEPWVSRLIYEAGGRVLFEESDIWDGWGLDAYPTTVVLARASLLAEEPELVERFLTAHVTLTEWIKNHPEEARQATNRQLEILRGRPLPPETMERAFSKVRFSVDIPVKGLMRNAKNATMAGFFQSSFEDITGLVSGELLASIRNSSRDGDGR